MVNQLSLALLVSTFAVAVVTDAGASLEPLPTETIDVGGRQRSFRVYVPHNLPPGSPAVFLLHDSGGGPEQMRAYTGAEFERVADESGVLVIYPEASAGGWNDCRSSSPADADDLRFLEALLQRMAQRHGIDQSRTFAAGLAGGGEMAMRIALEQPELFAGYAAVAANLPTRRRSECQAAKRSVPMFLIHGTKDPIDPFDGIGAGLRASLSTEATAVYWRKLSRAAASSETMMQYPNTVVSDRSTVAESCSVGESGHEVCLMTVAGGGHAVPHPTALYPDDAGEVNRDINGPREIWSFFERAVR